MSRGFIISLVVIFVVACGLVMLSATDSNAPDTLIALTLVVVAGILLGIVGLRLLGVEPLLRHGFRLFPAEREYIAEMYGYLARSVEGGHSVSEALARYSADSGPRWLRSRLEKVVFRMQAGESLSVAAARYPSVFPRDDRALLEVGERSDSMANTFTYLESLARARQVRHFPVFLVALELIYAPLIVGFILVMIIPKFKEIFDQLGAELPFLTVLLVDVSFVLSHQFIWIVLLLLLLVVLIRGLRLGRHCFCWLPILRRLYWSLSFSRFAFSLGSLLCSGMSPVGAVSIASAAGKNALFRKHERAMLSRLEQGEPLHRALAEMPFLPAKFSWFVKQGEILEQPGETLLNLAEMYREEHEISLFRLSSILLPIVILLIGAMVAFCVIALYLPLFNIPTVLFEMQR